MSEPLDVTEALVIHPGDKLIVRVDPRTSMDHVKGLRDAIRERLPEDVEVLIIAAEQLAVLRG